MYSAIRAAIHHGRFAQQEDSIFEGNRYRLQTFYEEKLLEISPMIIDHESDGIR